MEPYDFFRNEREQIRQKADAAIRDIRAFAAGVESPLKETERLGIPRGLWEDERD